MFSLALFTLALSAALSLAGPAKRAPALEVSLSAPANVASIDEIKITAAVTNTGSEDVKVLKYGTVLDGALATRSFKVSKGGVEADFIGIKLQIDMSLAGDSAFVVIPAGETILVEHDVAPLFDFEALGAGSFEFEPLTTFQVVDEDARPNAYKVSVKTLKVNVKSDVQKRELRAIDKRAVVSCSSSSMASFISASYTEGKSLASIASSYIASNGANSLFRSYFGSSSTSSVRSVLNAVANENSSSRTLNCSDPYGVCGSGVIAYTLISGSRPIYYCSIFYNEVATSRLCSGTTVASRNVRGGTTLHELTHAASNTGDVGYGCAYDMSLAASSPSSALSNADNYNCFATQVYQNTQC
ncbi:Metalloprotease [Epithele typhae]|uniref:Metalloprotease n=1 Tax=Epithele typhae TaxID=378194 RepID=UPI002007693E|nr:Metalloprotease [Epithele typhae]KAH9936816.1 Metalloprotease [Epithele typhae]